MTKHDMLIELDDNALDVACGGTGCLPTPCQLVEGALELGASVVGCGLEAVAGVIGSLPKVQVCASASVRVG
ncbi:MAG: hypothetical protein JWN48_4761 [Myxococcaceae bacterium]|nr:hypothetical protein [Myxococcaceae bacterium]